MLLRRTRLGLLAARELTGEAEPAAASPVARVAHVLAQELGWSEQRLGQELERFAEEARAEGIVADIERPAPSEDDAVPVPEAQP